MFKVGVIIAGTAAVAVWISSAALGSSFDSIDGRTVCQSGDSQKGCLSCDNEIQPFSVWVGGEGFTNKLSFTDRKWSGSGISVCIDDAGRVLVSAPSNALCWVRMTWRHAWPKGALCLGDTWERSYGDLEWKPIVAKARLSPWYFLVNDGERTDGYGVEVQPNAFACWNVDSRGYSLRLDLRAGSSPVKLGSRTLEAVRIVTRKGVSGESAFQAGRAFCRIMCPYPRLPKEPVYGYNDWYCAYGKNTATNFLLDAAYISRCADGLANRPYVVMDDGWQEHSPPWMKENTGVWQSGVGPWDRSGTMFGMEMSEFCRRISALNAKPGLWYRPLAAWPDAPKALRQRELNDCFDPTLPEVRRMILDDMLRFRKWGFKLVKIDYLTYDICRKWTLEEMGETVIPDGKATWRDASYTTCEVMKRLYGVMREGAGDDMVIIGCNAINHIAAGLFEVQRIGNDTSGRRWVQTRKYGVNALGFRSIQNGTFFAADGDCCGLAETDSVPWEKNRQWMDLIAKSGTPFFVSWSRNLADGSFINALVSAFKTAAAVRETGEPLDWMHGRIPSHWRFEDGSAIYEW